MEEIENSPPSTREFKPFPLSERNLSMPAFGSQTGFIPFGNEAVRRLALSARTHAKSNTGQLNSSNQNTNTGLQELVRPRSSTVGEMPVEPIQKQTTHTKSSPLRKQPSTTDEGFATKNNIQLSNSKEDFEFPSSENTTNLKKIIKAQKENKSPSGTSPTSRLSLEGMERESLLKQIENLQQQNLKLSNLISKEQTEKQEMSEEIQNLRKTISSSLTEREQREEKIRKEHEEKIQSHESRYQQQISSLLTELSEQRKLLTIKDEKTQDLVHDHEKRVSLINQSHEQELMEYTKKLDQTKEQNKDSIIQYETKINKLQEKLLEACMALNKNSEVQNELSQNSLILQNENSSLLSQNNILKSKVEELNESLRTLQERIRIYKEQEKEHTVTIHSQEQTIKTQSEQLLNFEALSKRFFFTLSLLVKISLCERGHDTKANFDVYSLFERVVQQNVPYENWGDWIMKQVE